MNLCKTRLLSKRQQISLVEVQHGATFWRLNTLKNRTYFTCKRLDRGHVISHKDVGRLGIAKAVDRFKDGKTTIGFEDTIEFVEGLLLGLYVNQDGTGGHHIHRTTFSRTEIISRCPNELTAIKRLYLLRKRGTVIQQVL